MAWGKSPFSMRRTTSSSRSTGERCTSGFRGTGGAEGEDGGVIEVDDDVAAEDEIFRRRKHVGKNRSGEVVTFEFDDRSNAGDDAVPVVGEGEKALHAFFRDADHAAHRVEAFFGEVD